MQLIYKAGLFRRLANFSLFQLLTAGMLLSGSLASYQAQAQAKYWDINGWNFSTNKMNVKVGAFSGTGLYDTPVYTYKATPAVLKKMAAGFAFALTVKPARAWLNKPQLLGGIMNNSRMQFGIVLNGDKLYFFRNTGILQRHVYLTPYSAYTMKVPASCVGKEITIVSELDKSSWKVHILCEGKVKNCELSWWGLDQSKLKKSLEVGLGYAVINRNLARGWKLRVTTDRPFAIRTNQNKEANPVLTQQSAETDDPVPAFDPALAIPFDSYPGDTLQPGEPPYVVQKPALQDPACDCLTEPVLDAPEDTLAAFAAPDTMILGQVTRNRPTLLQNGNYTLRNLATTQILSADTHSDGSYQTLNNLHPRLGIPWTITRQADSTYRLVDKLSGRLLTVLDTTSKNVVAQTSTQKTAAYNTWIAYPVDDSTAYALINPLTELAVTLDPATGDYSLAYFDNLPQQKWSLTALKDLPNGRYGLRVVLNNKYIFVRDASTANGIPIVQKSTDPKMDQYGQWDVTKLTDGSYKIINVKTGKSLYNGNTDTEGQVTVQSSYSTAPSCNWSIAPIDQTTYLIRSVMSEQTLGLAIRSWTDGVAVAQNWPDYYAHPAVPTNHFEWRFVPITTGGRLAAEEFTKEEPLLVIYPNPAADQVTLRYSASQAQTGQLAILQGNGRLASQRGVALQAGLNEVTVSTASLPTGQYIVQLVADGRQLAQKLIIARP